jgi:ribonucleoside-diphosphate reductase alpha chain
MTQRERLPNRREHVLVNFTAADGFSYTAGLGYFDDGRLAEIFLNAKKIGTAIETTARDSAVVASLALQHGVPTETIRRAVTRSGNGSATGPLGTLLDLLASGIEP